MCDVMSVCFHENTIFNICIEVFLSAKVAFRSKIKLVFFPPKAPLSVKTKFKKKFSLYFTKE